MLPAETDGLLTSGLRQAVGKNPSIPTLGTVTGILTDPQFRLIIRAIEQRDGGVDLLSAAESHHAERTPDTDYRDGFEIDRHQ